MTVLEVIQRSTEFLARKGLESPRLQVELLLAHLLRMPRLKLYLNFDRTLTEKELEATREFIKRRSQREPLQHILGSTSFCGWELKVNPHVLIPRPETELLAEHAWNFLGAVTASAHAVPAALDFGSGSGCLAIALALKCPVAQIHAVDISSEALAVARENAVRHAVGERIQFWPGDGFSALPLSIRFDLVVANPPYIASAEIDRLQPEVRDYDPRLALDGGADGLDFFRRLAVEASAFLRPGGKLMLEFGDGQAPAIHALLAKSHWSIEATQRDYTQRERILSATVKREAAG